MLRPRIRERRAFLAGAFEPELLVSRRKLNRADAALQQGSLGVDVVVLVFAGDKPGAADVPRRADEVGQILIAIALLLALLARLHPFGAEGSRTGRPVELRAKALAPAFDVDALEEVRGAPERFAAKAVQPFRHI